MKLSIFLYIGVLCASTLFAQTLPITGPLDGFDPVTGERPFRQDIKNFQNSGPAWDLYIQALQNITLMDESSLTSYFQIAGIHGYPNIPWDGVNGNAGGIGYCAHNTVEFPTWHRPYMALFEISNQPPSRVSNNEWSPQQIIWQAAQSIAQTYPDSNRDSYVAAAKTLRIPFWDWSVDASIPAIASVNQVQINTPGGQQTVDNPLSTYNFPPAAQGLGGNPTNTARNANANQILQTQGFHAATYTLYSSQSNYAPFANAAWLAPGAPHWSGFRPSNSLEHIHNLVHQKVGGQMSDLTMAAFDPLFWLHHANVDRVFAIWQAIHPDQFTVPWITTQSDYVTPVGTTVDVNTPLYPFHSDDQSTIFTSASVRSTRSFGYTYPEVQDWGMNADPAILKANVTAIVNQIYNPHGSGTSQRRHISRRSADISAANAASYNWVIGVVADKSRLNQSLSLHFYISEPPSDSASWATDSNAIGSDVIIVSRPPNAVPSSAQLVSGQTFVTGALLARFGDISPAAIAAILKEKLQWRAVWADGRAVSAEEMGSLRAVEVSLAGQAVTQTKPWEEFPVYGDWELFGEEVLGEKGWSML